MHEMGGTRGGAGVAIENIGERIRRREVAREGAEESGQRDETGM